ncbi:MAG: phage tail protein [Gammaproteobacteria bacterium]|nr:phage tail protein [Gammaproteobacteria bacterium]
MAEFIPYQFQVNLFDKDSGNYLCGGSFSEVSGLEVSMEVNTIREGGRNWGEIQLTGQTTFANILIKRGVTKNNDLSAWLDICTQSANYALRLNAEIDVFDQANSGKVLLRWKIKNALPVKFKAPDLSSTASQIAIEELEFVHEGITLERL